MSSCGSKNQGNDLSAALARDRARALRDEQGRSKKKKNR
jgi:hypothetical protein